MSQLEHAGLEAFLDDSLELRRLFAESWGTFLLVLVAAGAGVTSAVVPQDALALPVRVAAPGATVMAVIYFMGTISGAHLNPAVTWAFALRGNFPWRRVPGYLGAQALGALAAAGFLALIFGSVQSGMTRPGSGMSSLQAVVAEFVLTLGLVSVILGTSSGARNIGPNAAIAVGGYIGIVAVWAAPVSGASMNPARSLAPAILSGSLSTGWVYVLGPLAGATAAVAFEYVLKGPATAAGKQAAQGTLTPQNRSGS
jgi:aquaporin Z